MISDIDFVVTWVDNNDKDWKHNYLKFKKSELGDSSEVRFRNWDNFNYWLRGVFKYAPWVRKIHVITEGHLPNWLDSNCKRINIVKHHDYISSKYLPTFNSIVIENNIYKIKDLSNKFVLFNDDFFITKKVEPRDFFLNEKPLDMAVQNVLNGDGNSCVIMNILSILNNLYSKREIINSNLSKWLNYKYGIYNLRNILLNFWPNFCGFVEPHLPQSYLKSDWIKFNEVIKEEIEIVNHSRFRNKSDINHYIYRYFNLITGNFKPHNRYKIGSYYTITDDNCNYLVDCILQQKQKILVLNDGDINNFEFVKKSINDAFNILFSESCECELSNIL